MESEERMDEKAKTPDPANPGLDKPALPMTPGEMLEFEEGVVQGDDERMTKSGRLTLAQIEETAAGPDEHEGGTDKQVGDRTGPGAGYDKEPAQVKDEGGVS